MIPQPQTAGALEEVVPAAAEPMAAAGPALTRVQDADLDELLQHLDAPETVAFLNLINSC